MFTASVVARELIASQLSLYFTTCKSVTNIDSYFNCMIGIAVAKQLY